VHIRGSFNGFNVQNNAALIKGDLGYWRSGKTSWNNCVLAHREVNSRKVNRLPHEADLRLRKQRVVPASALIRNYHGVRDWQHFLSLRRLATNSEPL